MKRAQLIYLLSIAVLSFACTEFANVKSDSHLSLWYQSPAQKWADAFPLGNGHIAAMCYGGTDCERYQLNEESLWAGSQINPYAENYNEKLKKIQAMVLAGEYAKAHDFGVENLTAKPTSFRSYEPLADLTIQFAEEGEVSDYKRELDLSTGISRISYKVKDTEILRESFVSAVDDVLCIRLFSKGKAKLNCTIGLTRHKDAKVTPLSGGSLNLDGQIVDIDAPDVYDDNPGGSGPGGRHMRFAGRLISKISEGTVAADNEQLVVENAGEVLLMFTASTDYNLSLMNFDSTIDPAKKADGIIDKVRNKSWKQLKKAHATEHTAMFNRVSLDLGHSPKDSLPTDQRLGAFGNGAEDHGLVVQLFQFGRYLLMGSSREPAVLPANLQGKWNESIWAPWEADYHLNVNLQMNYWPADVTNLPETIRPLTTWFDQLCAFSKPLAKEMYNSSGWYSCLATNPFGRITPSASTPESQFINGVLDPLAGAWMVMNLWDHYEFSQDRTFLEERLYPLLKGASSFILDVLVADSEGTLHFVPSTSPENSFIDADTGKPIRITSNSTYHLSVIRAVFKATLEAAGILDIQDEVCDRIIEKEIALPPFSIDKEGRLMEWREAFEEAEPGHRHLSHLLGVHPFALLTPDTPELFDAARKSLAWRQENGQGGGGWSGAHAQLMHARFLDGEKAYQQLKRLFGSGRFETNLLNAGRIFQIDANFGVTAAMAEMLIQSHMKDDDGNFIIHLLPALPAAWSSGSFEGLRGRGGFEVDLSWNDGSITSASISSEKGGDCSVLFRDNLIRVSLKPGERKMLTEL